MIVADFRFIVLSIHSIYLLVLSSVVPCLPERESLLFNIASSTIDIAANAISIFSLADAEVLENVVEGVLRCDRLSEDGIE